MITDKDNLMTYCLPLSAVCYVSSRNISLTSGKKLPYNPLGTQNTCHEIIVTCTNQDTFIIVSYDENDTTFNQFTTKLG